MCSETNKVIKPNHLHILKIKDKEGDFLYYIQEADKLKIAEKLFNIIKIEGDKIILPITNSEALEGKKAEKLAKKTKKLFHKTISKKVIISNHVRKSRTIHKFTISLQFRHHKRKMAIRST